MPASAPHLLLATCRCTCGAATATSNASRSTATRSASTSHTPTHRLRPQQRWVLPNFAIRKRAADLPAPRPQKFENKITLPDGSTSSIYTTSPRPNIAISKDTSNHPLWGFPSASGASGPVEDEGGRMGRFARRFANKEETSAPSSPAEDTASASKAEAAKTAKKDTSTGKQTGEKEQVKASSEEPATGGFDMFDLSLEGEEVEVPTHKIVEDTGKKGKKGSGKKK